MLPAIFAEFAPLSPGAQWAGVSILGVVLTILLIWSLIRRKPPLDTELVKLQGSIDGLNKSVGELTENQKAQDLHATGMVKLQASIDGLNKSVGELTETQRAHASHGSEISKLQEDVRELRKNREEDLRAQREYTRQSGERVFKRIDEMESSVNKNFQSVERALGQLEGQIKSMQPR